jgi:mono/diheme cytochrome c family protein
MRGWLPAFLLIFGVAAATGGTAGAQQTISTSVIRQGFAASPISKSRLNLAGKTAAQVGLGSYLVNGVADCAGCHSLPKFLPQGDDAGNDPTAGDPYEGTPRSQGIETQLRANANVKHYLAGGQCFGPLMSYNLTPDASGRPLGLTEQEFVRVMRTGADIACKKHPADPICTLGPNTAVLQVMPWPAFHSMTDEDLKAIYAYLSAIPSAKACNTVADGCPGFSGAAAKSTQYAYPNTKDCPNPPPP